MARTLDGVEIHSTQVSQFHIKLFVTSDGHAEAFSGLSPQEAHDKGYAWLQTLPSLSPEAASAIAVVDLVAAVDAVMPIPVAPTVTTDAVVTAP